MKTETNPEQEARSIRKRISDALMRMFTCSARTDLDERDLVDDRNLCAYPSFLRPFLPASGRNEDELPFIEYPMPYRGTTPSAPVRQERRPERRRGTDSIISLPIEWDHNIGSGQDSVPVHPDRGRPGPAPGRPDRRPGGPEPEPAPAPGRPQDPRKPAEPSDPPRKIYCPTKLRK